MFELTTEALVAAEPDVIWDEWTDATLLEQWYWPPRLEPTARIDLMTGEWTVRSAIAEMAVLGTVVAAEPPLRLRLRWQWEGEEHATDVDVQLEPAADASTRVIVRHTGFLTDAERDAHIEGWTHCLDRLVLRHAEADR